MSSNRPATALKALLALGLAAAAAGCASTGADRPVRQAGLTPTEQYAIDVTPHEDQIMLAPHADALSAAQSAAIQDMVNRWRDVGEGGIRIQAPAHGGEEAYRATALIEDAIYGAGVRPDQVRVVDYDPGARPHAPILVGFTRYDAKGPLCGRNWPSYTSTFDNGVTANFGCAVTANVAALLANPGDLVAPQPEDPSDVARREVILGKYRQGQTTSSAKDDQASGAVSNVSN